VAQNKVAVHYYCNNFACCRPTFIILDTYNNYTGTQYTVENFQLEDYSYR